MSNSKAKKHREKLIREGKLDVSMKRGSWGNVNPYARHTKTKQEALAQMQNKHRKNHSQKLYGENGSFYLLLFALQSCKATRILHLLESRMSVPTKPFT